MAQGQPQQPTQASEAKTRKPRTPKAAPTMPEAAANIGKILAHFTVEERAKILAFVS